MIILFNHTNEHRILIPDNHLIKPFSTKDDYFSIELKNFDWPKHTNTCVDCRALLDACRNPTYADWLVNLDGEVRLLDLNMFGKEEDYFTNLLLRSYSYNFTGTKMRFNTIRITDINSLIQEFVDQEEYRICGRLATIRKNI